MAFKQYTHCANYDDFKNHWQGSSQSPVLPLIFNGVSNAIGYAILGGVLGALIGSFFGGAGALVGLGIGAWIGFAYGFADGFCDQWLNWRLICIDGDQCAGGRVAHIEPVSDKTGFEWLFDNDLSFNVRLVPHNGKVHVGDQWQIEFPWGGGADYGLDKIVADAFPASDLLHHPQKSDGTEWDLSYKGYGGDDNPNNPGGRWTIHCEIEGNGMDTLCNIAKVLAALAPLTQAFGVVAGAVAGAWQLGGAAYNWAHDGCKKACSVPILCDIICFIAGAIAAIVGGIIGAVLGAIAGAIPGLGQVFLAAWLSTLVRDDGSFSDVANDPQSGTISPEDCVFVFGTHVYDAGHSDGWSELHPVKHLQKVCCTVIDPVTTKPKEVCCSDEYSKNEDFYYACCCPSAATQSSEFSSASFRTDVQSFWDRWCKQVATGRDPGTIKTQQEPENQWCIHPLIDGCSKKADHHFTHHS